MSADSLCLFKIHAAADHLINNDRVFVIEFYDFNRERKSIRHFPSMRRRWPRSTSNALQQAILATCRPSGVVFRAGRQVNVLASQNAPPAFLESWEP